MANNDGGYVFPYSLQFATPLGGHVEKQVPGLSLRAYFAIHLESAMIASPAKLQGKTSANGDEYADMAVNFADALIAELNKEE
jgi:hypothetical protein